tara:strand:+ start:932 stop:1543 length:612 start_codon:yes stop_codon:yes gene_type:complete
MNSIKYFVLLVINVFVVKGLSGQDNLLADLESTMKVSYKQDSIIYTQFSDSVYNPFSGRLVGQFFVLGKVMLKEPTKVDVFNPVDFEVIIKVDSSTFNGYYKVLQNDSLILLVDILNNEFSGIGSAYFYEKQIPAVISQFQRNLLNGITFVYLRSQYRVSDVVEYKKGKYLEHKFHYLSLSKYLLKEGPKKKQDPLIFEDITN